MAVENTDLERRVLAHEQILQALMAQLSEAQPNFLDRMHERFTSARRGSYEHDFVETADYAEAFLHEVARLVRARPPETRQESTTEPMAAAKVAPTPLSDIVLVRAVREHGVWHVTKDGAFVGDYLSEASANAAAADVAREVERSGRPVEARYGPDA